MKEVSYEDLKNENFNKVEIITIEKFKTNDGKLFDNKKEALDYQKYTNVSNYIIELLGGNINDDNKFGSGESYYVLNKDKLEQASKLIQSLKDELGYKDYEITSRRCYEDDYLSKISSIVCCICESQKNKNLIIRVGQPYFVKNQDKLGDICLNPEELNIKPNRVKKASKSIKEIDEAFNNYSLKLIDYDTFKDKFDKAIKNIEDRINDGKIKESSGAKLESIYERYINTKNSSITKTDYNKISNQIKKFLDIKNEVNDIILQKSYNLTNYER